MKEFDLLTELMEAFKVKMNPVVSFWFCRTDFIEDKSADFPEDFDKYQLYKKKKFWMDDKEWACYIKQEMRGYFSNSYWKVS